MGQVAESCRRTRERSAGRRRSPSRRKSFREISKLGVSIDRAGVAKIETGIRGVLDFELVALAKALGVKVTWLLGIND